MPSRYVRFELQLIRQSSTLHHVKNLEGMEVTGKQNSKKGRNKQHVFKVTAALLYRNCFRNMEFILHSILITDKIKLKCSL